MKEPRFVRSRLHGGRIFPIEKIRYRTRQVTMREKPGVFNTIDFKYVEFVLSDMAPHEKETFQRALGALR